jgi:hypothetical protein
MLKLKHLRGALRVQEQLEAAAWKAANEPAPRARPMCRDCADLAIDGICPNSGRPCRTKQPNTISTNTPK